MFGRWFKKRDLKPGDDWPPLPKSGFVAGRAATLEDVQAGNAVFCQTTEMGDLAVPFQIAIPQYVLWTKEDGCVAKAILIQAEKHISDHEGKPVLGLRTLDGSEVVASREEVQMLGDKAPTR